MNDKECMVDQEFLELLRERNEKRFKTELEGTFEMGNEMGNPCLDIDIDTRDAQYSRRSAQVQFPKTKDGVQVFAGDRVVMLHNDKFYGATVRESQDESLSSRGVQALEAVVCFHKAYMPALDVSQFYSSIGDATHERNRRSNLRSCDRVYMTRDGYDVQEGDIVFVCVSVNYNNRTMPNGEIDNGIRACTVRRNTECEGGACVQVDNVQIIAISQVEADVANLILRFKIGS